MRSASLLCAKYVVPVMRALGGGAIVSAASNMANKGAVDSLTRAIALDHVADGIRVNALAPGPMSKPISTE